MNVGLVHTFALDAGLHTDLCVFGAGVESSGSDSCEHDMSDRSEKSDMLGMNESVLVRSVRTSRICIPASWDFVGVCVLLVSAFSRNEDSGEKFAFALPGILFCERVISLARRAALVFICNAGMRSRYAALPCHYYSSAEAKSAQPRNVTHTQRNTHKHTHSLLCQNAAAHIQPIFQAFLCTCSLPSHPSHMKNADSMIHRLVRYSVCKGMSLTFPSQYCFYCAPSTTASAAISARICAGCCSHARHFVSRRLLETDSAACHTRRFQAYVSGRQTGCRAATLKNGCEKKRVDKIWRRAFHMIYMEG